VTTVKEQVDALIDAHCEAHADYRAQRYRVAMAEMSGQPDPETVASVEASLTKVYRLLRESSITLAAVAAEVDSIEGDNNAS
jgi:hypothetical protein